MDSGRRWTWLAGTELPVKTGGSGQQIPETQQEKVAGATGNSLDLSINSCELLSGNFNNYLGTEFQRTDSAFACGDKAAKDRLYLI